MKMIELARKAKNIIQNLDKDKHEIPKGSDDAENKENCGNNSASCSKINVVPSTFASDFVVEELSDFDSDNTVLDPDFTISENDMSSVNSLLLEEEVEKIGDEIAENAEMGRQIERNLSSSSPDLEINEVLKWNRKNSKEKRNKGESYISASKKVVAKRKLKPLNYCRNKCKSKIPFIIQQQYFEKYWALGSYNQRILYIGALLNIKNKKTETQLKHPTKSRNRKHNIEYHLEYKNNKIKVCQKCFRQCFDETESFLKTVVKKKLQTPNIKFSDLRGSDGTTNKLSETTINAVKDHINSFPAYESHYSRRDTNYKYFHSDLSLALMHRLFCEKYNSKIISIGTYSKIFKGMKIKFKKPKIDTCSTCDRLKAKIDIAKNENNAAELEEVQNQQSIHHNKTELAYESKRTDKLNAKSDPSIKVYTFDLQQCLPTPFLRNSISFYKRQLWTYNLTVHDCVTESPYCYMWHEAISGRGGNQIASCLYRHINSLNNNPGLKHLIFYSDSCVGQNKNSFVSIMFITALAEFAHLETIDHKFLEPGHTHMECDSDHALIEKKKKKTETLIHHPHDWYNFIRSVGVKKKFSVIEMEEDNFYDFSALLKLKYVWRAEGERFLWNNVRWIRYIKNDVGKIFYKTSLKQDEPFQILKIGKRGISNTQFCVPKLKHEVKITENKKKDIEDLLCFINPCFHLFYKSLPTENNQNVPDIHPDLVDSEDSEVNNE